MVSSANSTGGALTSAEAPVSQAVATKRVVYFVASHVHPEQILRLIRVCRSGGEQSRVLLHHDHKCSALDLEQVRAIDRVEMPDLYTPIRWGGFSQLEMILTSMRWLIDNRDFDWVVYLSGQDFPVQPLAQVERFLTDTPYDGFVQGRPIHERPWHIGGQRYLYQYHTMPRMPGLRRLHALIERHSEKVRAAGRLPRFESAHLGSGRFQFGVRPTNPFRDGNECYKGSAWWTLSRKAIAALLRIHRERPELARHYRRAGFAPNESYIQTLLRTDRSLNLMGSDDKRFIRWSDPDSGHPDVLRCAHFQEMINSGKHFARKIDSRVDPKLLDMLDEHIGVRQGERA